ncbi:hypothetical protein DAEQUDRAFT_763106 [Daedalea quercina L-15889]|uniref:Uncharacterized protein n=1 Tax=Daedalea quercina L-15889 TaxID=1314783 RepID=A0A165SRS1_9APHY|nr:hypothetical protein DAEQUDRAFT_763106 [Daedalea quercina L-15889]
MTTAPKTSGWVTVAIALPIIAFVAIVILILVFIRRRLQKRAQQLEDGAVWERGPLIMVNQTTVVHKDTRWSLPRKPTLRVPFLSWNSPQQQERPAVDATPLSTRSSEEGSYISIRYERATNDSTPDPRSPEPDTSSSSYHTPQSSPSGPKEGPDDSSSLGHDVVSATPRLAVRIPQWPAWIPRWPSPSLSRKESSSQGHSASSRSDEPYPHLKLQPPRIVRLEPSFLREYRSGNAHVHTESTTSLIPSAAPPGTRDAPTPIPTPPPASIPSPPPWVLAYHDSNTGPNPPPPSRTPSVPASLLAGSRRPSVAPSPSSSMIARFPRFEGDGQRTAESLSRTSTAPSEFADGGRLPNPFASSASPWRTVLTAVGEVSTAEPGEERAAGRSGVGVGADGGQASRPTTPGSPLPRVRSQRAFHAMPLCLEPTPEERPASTAAFHVHMRSAMGTLSSKPSHSGSAAMLSPNPSYSTGGSART